MADQSSDAQLFNETTHLRFWFHGTSDSGKTDRFTVSGKNDLNVLGWIDWYSPWRRYTYHPTNQTLYDSSCLKEIAEFIDKQMQKRIDAVRSLIETRA